MTETFETLLNNIAPPDQGIAHAAQHRLDRLTKPPGSLGMLETLVVRLAGATGHVCPRFEQPVVVVAAADHGVVVEGVSPYPQAVTTQMVMNFLRGGAAINALAANAGARVVVADAGVASPPPNMPGLRRLAIRQGSGNLRREPAMSRGEAEAMMLAGARLVDEEIARGMDLLALGEMGIGNTTAAACLTCALTGISPELATGRGTGIDDEGLARKRLVVAEALERAQPRRDDPLGVLAELGGLEIALLVGATLSAASRRMPIVLDGYITTSAALVAAALAPHVTGYMVAAHRSAEPGHRAALEQLGLRPLLELDMRLGEGSGAALAIPLIQGAARAMRDMATFDEAGVSDRDE